MNERIRRARENAGYSREKFAELLGVSVSYVSELERGRTGISIKNLKTVCNLLGLSADYILFGEERSVDQRWLDKLHHIDKKYMSLVETFLQELLALQ